MNNLVKRIIAPIILSAAIIGCSTFPNYQPVELGTKDGYYAESQTVLDELDLITRARVGEVTLEKRGNEYVWKETGRYLQSAEVWNSMFDSVCRSADKKGNKHITNSEAQDLLNLTYRAIVEPVPTQDIHDGYIKA
jgi:hypothetical protein